MKIILKENIENLGEAGQIVKVADGYARNYLIPRGLAEEATAAGIARAKEYQKTMAKKTLAEKEEAEKLTEVIQDLKMKVTMKAGEKGKLFGSVTKSDIAEFLQKNDLELDKKKIELEENIKTLGTHIVPIKIHKDVTCELEVEVLEEE